MKNTISALLIMLLGSSMIYAGNGFDVNYQQEAGQYQLEFNLGEVSLGNVNINGQTFTTINFEGRVTTNKAGYAELPFIHASLMLEEANNVDLQFSGAGYQDYQLQYPLLPSRGVIYRNQDPSDIPYLIDPKSITDNWYPGNLAENTEPYILRDVRGTNVYVYPFQYNAAKNVLRVYNTVNVTLTNNNTPPVNPLAKHNSIVYEMDAFYASVFINYGDYRDDLTIGEMGDILVVCTDRDEAAMEPYIQWKREKGFNVTKEVVAAGTNVNTLVQNAYTTNNDLLYVQLVGDWADIKCNTLNGGSPPMDPQVGCVAGTDEVPDIAIGRLSAENPTHVTTQVDKVITYEKFPAMGDDWYKTATGIGSIEGPGDDGEKDFEHLDVIFNDKLDVFTYDNYNPTYEPTANIADVTAAVNGGTSVINYCGHGSPTSWGTTGFSNSNVANLTNGDMTPWIISVACNNGDFHTGTCFAEAWQRQQGGGTVMFLGASISQPWSPPMRGQDYFADIFTGGYDYTAAPGQNGISTTEGRTTIGTIVFNGLVLMTTEAGNGEDWETAKTWNLFGDPSMQVRSDVPAELTLSNQLLMVGIPFSTIVTTDGNPVEGAMVTISQDGEYFTGLTDETGSVSIPHTLLPGDALLVVTGFNTETIYETVTIIPPDGAYVMYAGHSINDASGNNNGMMDYGESVMITVSLVNVGVEDATDVVAMLSTDDDYASITVDEATFGNIPAGDTITISNAFALDVATDIPDLHNVLFNVEASGQATWASSFLEKGHAPVLVFGGYEISDTGGNGNGKVDPGETVDIILTLNNEGSADASGVEAMLTTASDFITIDVATMVYGPMPAGGTSTQTYSVTADNDTPAGHTASFDLNISADLGISGAGNFFIVVGQIPVLVIDMDGNQNSSSEMMTCFENLSVGAEMVDSWPDDMNLYSSIFVCLGVYPDNYVLSQAEGQELANYLNAGGNVYMEGGDTWFYDGATPVHPMFGIQGIEDGGSDLATIAGQAGTFTDGLQYEYTGDNSWIDHIAPVGDAFTIFKNLVPSYNNAVAFDEGTYRTIGSSFEFGGLEEGEAGKDYLMHKYLEFFGIESIWVSLPEVTAGDVTVGQVYPNPFSDEVSIRLNLEQDATISVEVYNVNGQLMASLVNGRLQAGSHMLTWESSADRAAEGVYFFRIVTEDQVVTRKVILVQ